MVTLVMNSFSFCGDKPPKGFSSWWLGSTEAAEGLNFPSSDQISELWREYVPNGGELTIQSKSSNHVHAAIPIGSTPKRREKFITALAIECTST